MLDRPDPVDWVRARLRSDGHVHSTFSDGQDDPGRNLDSGLSAGLTAMVMADHVRRSTDWLPRFVVAVDGIRQRSPIGIRIGVETKLLDTTGALDLPPDLAGVELLLIADHQFPTPDGPVDPATVRTMLAAGAVKPGVLVRQLIAATMAAMTAARLPAVVVHPFSILAKIGVPEGAIPDDALGELAARCRETGTQVEVNEKWACPGVAVLRILLESGVDIVAGSDAHASAAVGRYDVVERLLRTIAPGEAAA